MAMPPELQEIPNETDVIGNIDLFMEYVASGQAARDYDRRMALRLKELDDVMGSPT